MALFQMMQVLADLVATQDGRAQGAAQRRRQSGFSRSGEAPDEHQADPGPHEMALRQSQKPSRLLSGGGVALIMTKTRHFDPHIRPQGDVKVQKRNG